MTLFRRRDIPRLLPALARHRAAQQYGSLLGAQGGAMLLSFVVTMQLTRGLTVAAYGEFRYVMTFLTFGATVLQLGWPYSASRLLALSSQAREQREIVGASCILLVACTMLGFVVMTLGREMAVAFGVEVPALLQWASLFLYVTLGQYVITYVCQGLNTIGVLSLQQVMPYVLLLPLLAGWRHTTGALSLETVFLSYGAVFTVVIIVGFLRVGVGFGRCRYWFRAIARENTLTGFPIYVGGLFGVATAQVVALWVARFVDPSRYGHYALALAMSGPLSTAVSSVGTVIFRSSAGASSLSTRILVSAVGFGIALGAMYWLATSLLLVSAFGSQYAASVPMAQAMGLGALFIGWGDILNRFLGAHGQGRSLRTVAVTSGTVGVVSAAILLPRFTVYGAIGSSLLAGATYLLAMIAFYVRFVRRDRLSGADMAVTDVAV